MKNKSWTSLNSTEVARNTALSFLFVFDLFSREPGCQHRTFGESGRCKMSPSAGVLEEFVQVCTYFSLSCSAVSIQKPNVDCLKV